MPATKTKRKFNSFKSYIHRINQNEKSKRKPPRQLKRDTVTTLDSMVDSLLHNIVKELNTLCRDKKTIDANDVLMAFKLLIPQNIPDYENEKIEEETEQHRLCKEAKKAVAKYCKSYPKKESCDPWSKKS